MRIEFTEIQFMYGKCYESNQLKPNRYWMSFTEGVRTLIRADIDTATVQYNKSAGTPPIVNHVFRTFDAFKLFFTFKTRMHFIS